MLPSKEQNLLSFWTKLWFTLQLEALYPDVYKNVHEYGNRYCKGVSDKSLSIKNLYSLFILVLYSSLKMPHLLFILQGIFGIYQGASNHEELHNLIKATVMIRRLKKDVLTELPVKRRQQVVFPSLSLISSWIRSWSFLFFFSFDKY